MKTQNILSIVLIFFVFGQINSQKNEKVNSSIESLLNSKNFEFIANTAIPLSGATRDINGNNYSITFTPEMVISNMPFYGRAYSGMAYGRNKGMRFKGKPENFNITNAENEYEITVAVKDESDTYVISVTTGNSGFATLSISSNDRGTISYQGEIVKIQK